MQGFFGTVRLGKGIANGKRIDGRLARSLRHVRHHRVRGVADENKTPVRPFVGNAVDILQQTLHDQFRRRAAEGFGDRRLRPTAEEVDKIVETFSARHRSEPIGLSFADGDKGQRDLARVETGLCCEVHIDVAQVNDRTEAIGVDFVGAERDAAD